MTLIGFRHVPSGRRDAGMNTSPKRVLILDSYAVDPFQSYPSQPVLASRTTFTRGAVESAEGVLDDCCRALMATNRISNRFNASIICVH